MACLSLPGFTEMCYLPGITKKKQNKTKQVGGGDGSPKERCTKVKPQEGAAPYLSCLPREPFKTKPIKDSIEQDRLVWACCFRRSDFSTRVALTTAAGVEAAAIHSGVDQRAIRTINPQRSVTSPITATKEGMDVQTLEPPGTIHTTSQ